MYQRFRKIRFKTLVAPQGRLLDRERKVDHVGKHGVPKGGGALRLRVRESFTDEDETNEHEVEHEKHGYHDARLGLLAEVFRSRQRWLLVHAGVEVLDPC